MAEADEGGGGFFVDVVGESRWNLGRNCEPLVPMGRGPAAKILAVFIILLFFIFVFYKNIFSFSEKWFQPSFSEKLFQPSFNCRCKVVKIKSLNI